MEHDGSLELGSAQTREQVEAVLDALTACVLETEAAALRGSASSAAGVEYDEETGVISFTAG